MSASAEILVSCEQFAGNPMQHAARLRAFMCDDEVRFVDTIAGANDLDVDNRGFRYSLLLLRNSGLLIPHIASPRRTNLAQAQKLLAFMLLIEANFCDELVRALESNDTRLTDPECRLRILDLLLASNGPLTNRRQLAKLAETGDSRFKARATQLLARLSKESQTIQNRFEQGDARSRADLVEALGNERSPETATLLHRALADGNNRVAANACLAAYRANDNRSLVWMSEMIKEGQAQNFRISAAWAMAQSRDPRFAHSLLAASRSAASASAIEGEAKLRAASLKALTSLERIDTWATDPDLTLSCVYSDPETIGRESQMARTLRLTASESNIKSTDWFLFSGGAPILDYEVTEPRSQDLRVRVVCSSAAFAELSVNGLLQGRSCLERVESFGADRTIARVARSLVADPAAGIDRFVFVMSSPAFLMDLDLREFKRECCENGCELVHIQVPEGLAAEALGAFLENLRKSFRIRFTGPLSGLNIRLRRFSGARSVVSERLVW